MISWATVVRGIAATKQALVPLAGAKGDEDGVHLSVRKSSIKKAPRVEIDGALCEVDLARLGHHYGSVADRSAQTRGRPRRTSGGR